MAAVLWNRTSAPLRWNLVLLAALFAGSFALLLPRLGAPHVLGLILPVLTIALVLLFFWAVANQKLSGTYNPGEAILLAALFSLPVGLVFVDL